MMRQLLLTYARNFIWGGLVVFCTPYTQGQSLNARQQQLLATRHDTTRLRIYVRQIDSLYQKRRYDSVYAFIQKALPLAAKTRSIAYRGRLYYMLGLYYRVSRLSNKSIATLQQSLRLFQQAGDTTYYAKNLYALAREYAVQSDYERAIEQSLYNIALSGRIKNPSLANSSYILLIAVYEDLKDVRMRQHYVEQYLQFAQRENSPEYLYDVYLLKAETADKKGDYRTGWLYYKKAYRLAYAQKGFEVYYVTETLLAMENNLRHQKQYKEGERLLIKAIQLNKQRQDLEELAKVWNALARNYQMQAVHTKSFYAVNKALDYARRCKVPSILMTVLPTAVEVLKNNGYFREALSHQIDFITLKDSLLSQQKNERIAQLQAQYDLEKKENTIQLLEKNAQLQRLKANEQDQKLKLATQLRLQLIFGIGLLITLLGVIIYFLRRSHLTQRQLNQQKQETEIRVRQLADSNSMKDRLLSILSHDLRSPVASLKASFTLRKMKPVLINEWEDLEKDVDRLSHTLDNTLYWALTQRSEIRVVRQQVNLREVVGDILEIFDGLIRHKTLTVTLSPASIQVQADENLMALVLRNLLHNAIKFTPFGGAIHITMQTTPAGSELSIRDTGVGMKLNGSVDKRKPEQGTGLGLILSEELMESNGGKLGIKSHPGQGTTVTLHWPATPQRV